MAALRLKMIDDYEIVFGAPGDIPGILMIQEANLPHNGGTLSVRLSADWFQRAILEESLVVCRREGAVVGYLLGASVATWGNVPIIRAMLCAFPPQPDFYLYGPICVAETERGNGLASAMFEELKARRRGRTAMLFVRADNPPPLRAHQKMGMRELGEFVNDGVPYVAFTYVG